MTAEAISLTKILSYLWVGVIVPAFMYLFKKQNKFQEKIEEKISKEIYTKVETADLVENKLAPVLVEIRQGKEARRENTKVVKDLTELITNLRIDLAGRDSSNKSRSTD